MPKRSTPFQKLVHHIQRQLASPQTVEESGMLRHRMTGTEREVDVVIRAQVGEHLITICVECIDQSRPADVTWVEQMKTKHEHLPTNRLLLVSRSGFTDTALTLATKLGIATYTPEEALDLDWTEVVGKAGRLFLARCEFSVPHGDLLIQTPEGARAVTAGQETQLESATREPAGTLQEFLESILSNHDFAAPAMDKVMKDGQANLECEFSTTQPVFAVDTTGRRHLVLRFKARIKVTRRTVPVELASLSWRGVPAAFGHVESALGTATMTFVEQEPGKVDATLSVNGEEVRLFPPRKVRTVGHDQTSDQPAPPEPLQSKGLG